MMTPTGLYRKDGGSLINMLLRSYAVTRGHYYKIRSFSGLFDYGKQHCKEITIDDMTMWAKDAAVLWKQEQLVRFQNGLERYNWEVLKSTFKLEKQAIIDGMIALGEQP
eukprot:2809100-Amphidinium_carterae.1